MNNVLRLACFVPALAILAFVLFAPTRSHRHLERPAVSSSAPLRYVTLDRMLREFAEQAQASRSAAKTAVLAQR